MVKLKFKPSRTTIIVAVVAAVAVAWGLAAGGDAESQAPGTLDDAARRACADFAAGRDAADSKGPRLSLADNVMASARRTDNARIADSASALGRKANNSDREWDEAADGLATACADAGWSAG
ncbi:hypothetical protein J2S43_001251 [Catenuloplanes nepalensis]|uniref:Uncharacterized protein n=1 Tax=Catenuloplanes nepalensis TaxID=587533 RepID=A0ABT9MMX4_9ACTN|nr:hypothetical protein [Catenuloplanes nepalensis]MDP9792739.1 hypothetical protein [Catenuloplanes nepalensis]